jgi:tetratricopeptide (TPR) repeat protein
VIHVVADDDWFRGPAWDTRTRKRFDEKLGRARSGRSQYLRIKGLGLTEADDPDIRAAGRELLHRVLDEHPDDDLQVQLAHYALAASLQQEGELEPAAKHYRLALTIGRSDAANAGLALAELITHAHWAPRYDEALELLVDSEALDTPFPSVLFRWNVTAARLAFRTGNQIDARECAERALQLLAENRAPFPRHPGVGLIETDERTVRELMELRGQVS